MINFDPPADSETYVHRIGRTGRAGRKGIGITLLTPDQHGDVTQLAGQLGLDHGLHGKNRRMHANGAHAGAGNRRAHRPAAAGGPPRRRRQGAIAAQSRRLIWARVRGGRRPATRLETSYRLFTQAEPEAATLRRNWSGSLGIGFARREGRSRDRMIHAVPVGSLAPAEERPSGPRRATGTRILARFAVRLRSATPAPERRRLRSPRWLAYLAMSVVMYYAVKVSPALALPLAPVTRRLPAAHIHRLPRLLARIISRVPTSQRVARHALRAARPLAVRSLAPRPRCSPRDLG